MIKSNFVIKQHIRPMKIIHTSDWHLGQNFYGYDRSEDHESMISQLIELIHAEEPDALVIAGDIFDV